MSSTPVKPRPLKVLCIHGYRQNAQSFREKTGSFRKMLKKYIECDFITAPHLVPPNNEGSAAWANVETQKVEHSEGSENPGERGWWFSSEDDYFKSTHVSDVSKGFEEAIDMIISKLESEKYDGILGFSQGACLLPMLCLMQTERKKDWFKFAILFSGFKSQASPHEVHYTCQTEIPSLHMYGETDKVISEEMSQEILQYFKDPTVGRHPGGHFVPGSSAQKQIYISFLEEMRTLCL